MFRWWQRRPAPSPESLLGRWKLVRIDGELDMGDGVTMVFVDDGTATSILHDGASDQIINLTYRVKGDTLLTRQHEQPDEERMRFHVEDSGHLVLDYGSSRLWFVRIRDQSQQNPAP